MIDAYIAVGSNVDPLANVPRGVGELARAVVVTGVSTFWESAPVGPPGQPRFVNGVLRVATRLPPDALKWTVLRRVEANLGRRRGPDRYAPRPLDLDLLLHGDLVAAGEDLVLPDPDIATRPFVAWPLLELAPDLRLPGSGRALREVAAALPRSMVPLPGLTRQLRARRPSILPEIR